MALHASKVQPLQLSMQFSRILNAAYLKYYVSKLFTFISLASSIQERLGDLYYIVRVSGHERNSESFGVTCIISLGESRTFVCMQPLIA